MLNQVEFQMLYKFHQNQDKIHYTQRMLAEELSISLGKTNQVITELLDKQLIRVNGAGSYEIEPRGMESLEPYKVKNAIIMAAGMSSRFAPLSYEKPKGLLRVKGDVLIEREILQLQEAGIRDITIVVGYRKEKFFYLEEKYGIKIVVNEDYYRYNNTSTLIRVLDQLSNTYICSSDNYFVDNVFEPYVYRAYYAAVYATGATSEYCLECDGKGRIKNVTIGGSDSWYMLGHVYFDRQFSEAFGEILKREYRNNVTRGQLWEDVYIRYIRNLDLYIRKYSADKVLEFDSLDELREFDSEYINNTDSRIMENISRALKCRIGEIVNIHAVTSGATNTSFRFQVGDQAYIYRHPLKGSEKYINRESEAAALRLVEDLRLDDSFFYIDEKEGWKVSYFINETHEMNCHNAKEVTEALGMLRRLHNAELHSRYDFHIWKRILLLREQLKGSDKEDFDDFERLFQLISSVQEQVGRDPFHSCLCHCGCSASNFLVDGAGKLYLTDWQYAGNDDPAVDVGNFICSSDYSYEKAMAVLEEYLQHTPTIQEQGHYMGYVAMAAYHWYLWALYQETTGKIIGESMYIWYKNARLYAGNALKCYSERGKKE